MKLYKVDAVVLKSREMRDADRILTLFSRQRGKIRAVAHGVNKPSSRKRGAVQPFCYSTFLLYRGRQLDSVNQCEGIEAFPGLRSDLDRLFYAGYLADLTDAVTMEDEVSEELFALLLMIFYLISRDEADIELLVRAFEIRLMSISGLRPHLESCIACGAQIEGETAGFSSGGGGVLCEGCSGGVEGVRFLPRGALEVLRLLLHWDLKKMGRIKVSPRIRRYLKQVMQDYIGYHVEKKFAEVGFWEKLYEH
jgi:DNA repair protein RecO (recombination protein O)